MSAMATRQQNQLGGYHCSQRWGLLRADWELLPRPACRQFVPLGAGAKCTLQCLFLPSAFFTASQDYTASLHQLLPFPRGLRRERAFANVSGFVLVEFIWISWRHPGECEPKGLNNSPELVRRAQIRHFFFFQVCVHTKSHPLRDTRWKFRNMMWLAVF